MRDVEVSLNEGVAVIRFRPDHRVTVRRVRDAIRDNGFSPKQAEVRVAGTVAVREGAVALVTPAGDTAFVVVAAPGLPDLPAELAQWVGDSVILEGTVPEAPTGVAGPPVLAVRAAVRRTPP